MDADELQRRLDALQAPQTAQAHRPCAPLAYDLARALGAGLEEGSRATARAIAAAEGERAGRHARLLALRATLEGRLHPALLQGLRTKQSPSALLLGPTGVGKTSAARWLQAGLGGMWVHARDLASCERRHSLGEGEPPALTAACSAARLYIDDLGTEDARDIPTLRQVYERRYAAGRATVTTTGLTRQMLSERYEAPTVRRILDQHATRSDGSPWPVLIIDLHQTP